jgi:hypothetical protein
VSPGATPTEFTQPVLKAAQLYARLKLLALIGQTVSMKRRLNGEAGVVDRVL